MQSPPPAVFHDKYQWEIWENTAGKSARSFPYQLEHGGKRRNRMLRRCALCPDNFRRLRTYKAPALIWGSRSLALSFSLWWRWSKAHDIEWRIAKTKKTTTTTSVKLHCGVVDQNNSGCGDTKMKVLVPSTSLRILQQRQDEKYNRNGDSTYNFRREASE